MNFTESIKTVLFDKYATIKGRASRSEFWWWILFVNVFGFLVGFLMHMFGVKEEGIDAVGGLINLLFLIPTIVVMARRFHDIGYSGWYVLWFKLGMIASAFIPLGMMDLFHLNQDIGIAMMFISMIGVFGYFIYLLTKKGDESENRFGPNLLLRESIQERVVEGNEHSIDIDLDTLTVKELKDLANKKGVKLLSRDTKAVIIEKMSQ